MESFTWNRIVAAMADALGCQARVVHVPSETLIRYNSDWSGPLLGDKTWSVMFDNTKVMSVAGEFECKVSLEAGMKGAAEDYFRRRADAYQPDEKLHALLDRICAEQESVGAGA